MQYAITLSQIIRLIPYVFECKHFYKLDCSRYERKEERAYTMIDNMEARLGPELPFRAIHFTSTLV